MFTALHALAQNSTLMIVVAAEADELRVSVTPTQAGDKANSPKLRPLSLLATPAELDAGFAEALAVWQAPKLSLLEQAKASADDESDDDEPAGAAAKAPGTKRGRPAKKSTAATDAAPAKDTSDDSPAPEQAPATRPAPAAINAAVDTVTLDLF